MPTNRNLLIARNSQKPLSITTSMSILWRYHVSRKQRPTVLPFSLCYLEGLLRRSYFPSTSSISNITHKYEQQIVWYSIPQGNGLLGTTINPVQVYLFKKLAMLSWRNDNQLEKFFSPYICPVHQSVVLPPRIYPCMQVVESLRISML